MIVNASVVKVVSTAEHDRVRAEESLLTAKLDSQIKRVSNTT